MAVKAKRNAVVGDVFAPFRLVHDVVQLDLESAELVAEAAMAVASHQCIFLYLGREGHVIAD